MRIKVAFVQRARSTLRSKVPSRERRVRWNGETMDSFCRCSFWWRRILWKWHRIGREGRKGFCLELWKELVFWWPSTSFFCLSKPNKIQLSWKGCVMCLWSCLSTLAPPCSRDRFFSQCEFYRRYHSQTEAMRFRCVGAKMHPSSLRQTPATVWWETECWCTGGTCWKYPRQCARINGNACYRRPPKTL